MKGVTAHSLRHAFALHLIQNGADIRYAQELLGHAELQTTTVYTKLHDGDLKEKILRHHPGDAVLSKTIDLKSKFSPPLNAEIILSAQELTMKFPDETIISNASFGDVRKILKALREKKRLSIRQMAKQMNIDYRQIKHFENNRPEVRLSVLYNYVKTLGLKITMRITPEDN